jgi:hypothetical protein
MIKKNVSLSVAHQDVNRCGFVRQHHGDYTDLTCREYDRQASLSLSAVHDSENDAGPSGSSIETRPNYWECNY